MIVLSHTLSRSTQTLIFDGRKGDYFYMLLLGAISLAGVGIAVPFVILGHALIFMIIYYWSKKFADKMTGLFFITFKGFYLPWALGIVKMIFGKSCEANQFLLTPQQKLLFTFCCQDPFQ